MSVEQLADEWDRTAGECDEIARNTRSLDLYARERARAAQLRQCAMQLRLVIGAPADVPQGVPVTEKGNLS